MNIDPKAGLSTVSTSYVPPSATDETARDIINKISQKLLADTEQFPWLDSPTRAEGFNYNVNDLLTISSVGSRSMKAVTNGAIEDPIANELTGSIEKNAEQLQIILGWTQGGAGAFNVAILEMFNSYQNVTLQGIDYENLFQIGLLDVLMNQGTYGTTGTTFLKRVGEILEKTGSGSHNNWDYTPEQIGQRVNAVWSDLHSLISSGSIGQDTLIYKVMTKINGGNPPTATTPQAFQNQFIASVYNNPANGGWITDSLAQLTPMSRIVLLSSVIASHGVSRSEISTFLTGSKAQIDTLVMSKTGKDALTILFGTGKWQDSHDTNKTLPPGVTQTLDYDGWIDAAYLKALYEQFPPKDLTKEDLTEVNNIGDQVKMLMQTLKYWLTTVRDEQLSMSRNMS